MKNTVIYHANCADGFTAAWVCHCALGDENTTYVPMSYSDLDAGLKNEFLKSVAGHTVYMVDFSMPMALLEQLEMFAEKVIVLDHHKSFAEKLKVDPALAIHKMFCDDRIEVRYKPNHSGAAMTFDYFVEQGKFLGGIPPYLVRYTEDYDLWNWALPNSREINAYIATRPRTMKDWDDLSAAMENDVCQFAAKTGEVLLRSVKQQVEQIARSAYEAPLGLVAWVPTVNTCVYRNEVSEYLLEKHPTTPFVVTWAQQDRDTQSVSLRSRKGGFDVSELAKSFGGGGHASAAGFTLRFVKGMALNEE